jgi:flagellar hook-associated protein 2
VKVVAYIGALSGSQNQNSGANTLWGAGSGISGLASGLDTDSIVKSLVDAASIPLVNILQQRQILQWQQELYQKVENSLTALQNSMQSLRLQSTFLTQTATSTNTSIATATASPLAPAGSYQVSITQLAQGSTVFSSQTLSTNPDFGNTTLGALMNDGQQSYSVTINGEQFTFQPNDTINSVLSTISRDPKAGVSAFYDANSGKVVLQTTATGTGAQIKINDTSNLFFKGFNILDPAVQSFTYKIPDTPTDTYLEINGVKIQLSADDVKNPSLVQDRINAVSDKTLVQADVSGNTITLTPVKDKKTGDKYISQIAINDPSGLLKQQSDPSQPLSGVAKDAVYSINGFKSSSPTNTVNYNGLTINLMGKTKQDDTDNSPDNPVTITVTKNTDAIVQSIMNFVQQYNTTVQYIQGLYYQKRYLDYKPLTVQQESQMTEKQIDQWNQKAQSGLLANDMLLGDALDGLTSAVGATVNGQPTVMLNGKQTVLNSLAAIGIEFIDPVGGVDDGYTAPNVVTTGYNTFGLLEINTDLLKQAINANPDAVMRLFTNNPNLPGGSGNPADTGIAVRLYNSLTASISSIKQRAGSSSLQPPTNVADISSDILPHTAIDPNGDLKTLFGGDGSDISSIGQSIKDLDSRALDMQNRLQDLKERYQREFSAMESALANLSSMSAAFLSMMGQSTQG